MNEQEIKELESALSMCTGSMSYYPHWTKKIKHTEGIQILAERAGAYWLIDAVASYQHLVKVKAVPFQLWTLKVDLEQKKALLTMQEDIDTKIIVSQVIEYTDFPLKEIQMYLANGVLYLPSEH